MHIFLFPLFQTPDRHQFDFNDTILVVFPAIYPSSLVAFLFEILRNSIEDLSQSTASTTI